MSGMPTAARHPEPTPGPARTTYQDVLDAPAHRVAEIVEGDLHTHPRPAIPHALARSVLGRRVGSGLSLTALMEPPMFGFMEPLTGADLWPRTG